MLAKKFAEYVLQSRKHAIFVALLCAALPLLGWLSVVVVALTTLCKGAYEGFIVFLWALLAVPVMLLLAGTPWSWWVIIHAVLFGSLFVWMLAIVLRRYVSFVLAVECAVIVGVLAVIVVHVFIGDVPSFWYKYIIAHFEKLISSANVDLNKGWIEQVARMIAPYMTGMQSAIVVLGAIMQLLIARGLQAILYNPGDCIKEWVELRLSYFLAVITVVCFLLAYFGIGLFKDVVPVLILPFLVAGISLVHGCLRKWKISYIFIAIFYLMVVTLFVIQPLLLGILVVFAMLDSFVDFRSRIIK